jgi:hypothetical protein
VRHFGTETVTESIRRGGTSPGRDAQSAKVSEGRADAHGAMCTVLGRAHSPKPDRRVSKWRNMP